MRETLYDFCIRTGQQTLLQEWDVERNAPLTPRDLSYGSKKKVWWRCAHGHVWQAMVTIRTANHSGCPYCSHQRPWPGENDLKTLYPHIAAEWHSERNGDLRPEHVLPGSRKKVWWICKHGHVWRTMVKSRVQGCGCPVCSNRKIIPSENSLAVTHPALAAQWHPSKNGALTPFDVVAGSRRKVWWQCAHGHAWQAIVVSRAHSGAGCPVCVGKKVVPGENDLVSQFPKIAAQWDMEKNAPLTPEMVTRYSNRCVWWRCEKGHSWKTPVRTRTHAACGCPYCAGRKVLKGFNDLFTCMPEIAAQWHPTLNGTLTPYDVTHGSKKKVWWICEEGHVWCASIASRTGGKRCGCPVCAGKVKAQKQAYYAEMIAEHKKNDR